PNRCVPLPLLSGIRSGVKDQFSQPNQQLASPVAQFGNHVGDALRCFQIGSCTFRHEFSLIATSFLLMLVFAVVVRRPRTEGGSDDNRIDLGGHRTLHVSRDEKEGANERSYRSTENASIRIAAANFLRRAGLPLRRQNRRPDSNASPKRLSRAAPNGS